MLLVDSVSWHSFGDLVSIFLGWVATSPLSPSPWKLVWGWGIWRSHKTVRFALYYGSRGWQHCICCIHHHLDFVLIFLCIDFIPLLFSISASRSADKINQKIPLYNRELKSEFVWFFFHLLNFQCYTLKMVGFSMY